MALSAICSKALRDVASWGESHHYCIEAGGKVIMHPGRYPEVDLRYTEDCVCLCHDETKAAESATGGE